MAAWLESLGHFLRAPDPRSKRDVLADIEEELAFHLEQRTHENVASGMDGVAARADAERRFGDLEGVRRACRRVQLGDRIMLQRIYLTTSVLLLAGVVVLAAQAVFSKRAHAVEVETLRATIADLLHEKVAEAHAAGGAEHRANPPGAKSADAVIDRKPVELAHQALPEVWRARFAEGPDDWRHGLAVAEELALEESCDQASAVLESIWSELSVPHKEQLLKPFVFHGGKPCALRVLHLAATDASPAVRERAFHYLRDYAFEDFGSQGLARYVQWYESCGRLPLAEVFAQTAPALVQRLGNWLPTPPDLDTFGRLDLRAAEAAGFDAAGAMRRAGAFELVQRWMDSGDVSAQVAAVNWLAELEFDDAVLRAMLLPVLAAPEKYDSAVLGEVCSALGVAGRTWAVQPLLDYLRNDMLRAPKGEHIFSPAVRALAEIGDPQAVPVLIAWIVFDDSLVTIEGIGANGLSTLTACPFDPAHDGAFWRDWWERNRATLHPSIRSDELRDPR